MPGGCVIQLGVLQGAYSEVQGLVEADSSTTLDLAGSNQFMLCPQWLCYSFKGCALPLSYLCGDLTHSLSLSGR